MPSANYSIHLCTLTVAKAWGYCDECLCVCVSVCPSGLWSRTRSRDVSTSRLGLDHLRLVPKTYFWPNFGGYTSRKNLVNFCWYNSRDDRDHLRTYVPVWRQSTYISAFVVLPFRNTMGCWNADGRINSGNDQATFDKIWWASDQYL